MQSSRSMPHFAESTGVGYALEKIGDPGRGRKDPTSMDFALTSLDVIQDEHDRAREWAAGQRLNVQAELENLKSAIVECRAVLQSFRTQPPAAKAAKRVISAYNSLCSRLRAN